MRGDLRLRTPGKGLIWRKRPEVDASGFVTRICNVRREEDSHHHNERVEFSDVAIAEKHGAIADAMGRVYVLYFDHNEYVTIRGPGKRVTVMEFSKRNPNWLFVGLRDGHVLCFSTRSRKLFGTLHAHRSSVHSITFHPKTSMFVTTSYEGATIWSSEPELQSQSCLDGEDASIVDSGFLRTRSKTYVLILAFSDGSVIGWNTETLKVTFRLVPPESEIVSKANKISFARDRLVVAFESGVLHMWNVSNQELVHVISAGSEVKNVCFFPKGNAFLCLHQDGSVTVTSCKSSYRILHTVSVSKRVLTNCSLDPSGHYLMCTANSSGEAFLYVFVSFSLSRFFKTKCYNRYDMRVALKSAREYRHLRLKRLSMPKDTVDSFLVARVPGSSKPIRDDEEKKKKKRVVNKDDEVVIGEIVSDLKASSPKAFNCTRRTWVCFDCITEFIHQSNTHTHRHISILHR